MSGPDEKDVLEHHYRDILTGIGEDVTRQGLVDTPKRAASAFRYLVRGYHMDVEKVVNNAVFDAKSDDMIVVKDIELYSLCEHHLLPFFGKCHIAYIPKKQVIGLSKVARIVEVYARRLQIQENLTRQIADAILTYTQSKGVAVVIEAQHLCMMMRGVQKQNSKMKTSVMLGLFRKNASTRNEFMNLID